MTVTLRATSIISPNSQSSPVDPTRLLTQRMIGPMLSTTGSGTGPRAKGRKIR
jgi:hypothetical protein